MEPVWCDREDLNLHTLRHQSLKLACLPISPRSHLTSKITGPAQYKYNLAEEETARWSQIELTWLSALGLEPVPQGPALALLPAA